MAPRPRPASRKPSSGRIGGAPPWLPIAAVGGALAATAWVLLQGAHGSPPAAPGRDLLSEVKTGGAAAAALRPQALPPLEGEGPLTVELRWLGGQEEERIVPRRAGTLEGRVLGPGGEGVARARLIVTGGPQDGLATVAGQDGRYRFLHILPGTHDFRIEVPGRTPVVRRQRVASRAPTRRDFLVGEATAFQLLVRDTEGVALDGARVVLGLGLHEAVTGPDGLATFSGIPAGRPLLQVFAAGRVPLQEELNLPEGGARDAPVELPALRPGAVLVGRVRSWPGPPLPRVTAVPLADRPGDQIAWESWHDLPTDAAGRFELHGLPPDRTVTVRVFHPMGVAKPALRSVRPDRNTRLALTFVIQRGEQRVSGRVEGPDGEPLAGARVVLESEDPAAVLAALYPGLAEGPVSTVLPVPAMLRREMRTGAGGRFDFSVTDHLPGTGPLVLTASRGGFRAARRRVQTVLSGLVLRLQPADLSGRVEVISRDGRPLPPVAWFLEGVEQPGAPALQTGWYELRIRRGSTEFLFEPEVLIQGLQRYRVP